MSKGSFTHGGKEIKFEFTIAQTDKANYIGSVNFLYNKINTVAFFNPETETVQSAIIKEIERMEDGKR